MTRLILLQKGILGHFMQKNTNKHDFLGFLIESSFSVIETQTNVFERMLMILEHVD